MSTEMPSDPRPCANGSETTNASRRDPAGAAAAPPGNFPGPSALPAMQGLLTQILNTSRLADQRFYMVVVPDDDVPSVLEFATIEELIRGIQSRLGTPGWVFPFMGYRLHVSKGPLRWLLTPYGNLPLFSDTASPEPESSGYVGPAAVEIAFPPVSVTRAAAAPAPSSTDDDTPVLDS